MWGRNLILIVSVICTVWVDGAFCVPARRGRASVGAGGTSSAVAPKTTSARAAVNSRSGGTKSTTASASKTTSARAAVKNTATAPKAPTVAARAATTQKVIGGGTKVAVAASNTVVGDECQNLYNACMDTFCVVDNFDGGRCVCSDKYRTFDKLWTEIDDLNAQAYKLQTVGVETIEAVVTKNPGLQIQTYTSERKQEIKSALQNGEIGGVMRSNSHDICMTQIKKCDDKADILSAMYSGQINSDCIAYENSLKKLKSDAKQRMQQAEGNLQQIALDSAKSANKYDLGQCTIKFRECMSGKDACGADFTGCVDVVEQTKTRIRGDVPEDLFVIPGTTANLTISKSMYDSLSAKSVMCQSVLENCVKVKDNVFNSFLRDAYPQLMMAENMAESNARQNCIKNVSDCFLNACRDNIDPNDKDSYDACLTRPEMMLSFCKPQLDVCGVDSSNAKNTQRSEIWDFVLARLSSMKVDACTNDLKNCLMDEGRCGADYSKCVGLSTEQIIRMCPYDKLVGCKSVYDAELKTDEVYANLTNVVQGIVLNIDNEMLTTCQAAVDAAAIRVCGENLECGDMVNLDQIGTTSLEYKICEYKIVDNDVVFTDNCHADQSSIPDVDLGRVEYSASGELGPVVPYTVLIDVPIYWESISVGLDGKFVGLDDYMTKLEERQAFMTDVQKDRMRNELHYLKNGLENIILAIESDPIVNACMNGRKINGYDFKKVARFPNITQSTRALIATKLLNRAKKNYYAKYDGYNERQLKDFIKIAERQTAIKGENFKDKHREIARQSCVSLAEMSVLPKSPEPPASVGGGILLGVILAMVIVAVCVLTAGGGAAAIGAVAGTAGASLGSTAAGTTITTTVLGSTLSTVTVTAGGGAMVTGVTTGMAAAGIAGIVAGTVGAAGAIAAAGLAINDTINKHETYDATFLNELKGEHQVEYWNYKEEITTVFNPTDLTCEKCTVSTHCAKTKAPMFGPQYCEEWEESLPKKCTTIEF